MKFARNARGFAVYEFSDHYNADCSLQQSSLATEPAIWLGINDADPKIMAKDAASHGVQTDETTGWVSYPVPDAVLMTTLIHLSRKQVADLLPILNHFSITGKLPELKEQ